MGKQKRPKKTTPRPTSTNDTDWEHFVFLKVLAGEFAKNWLTRTLEPIRKEPSE
jgi:hypothetical protein